MKGHAEKKRFVGVKLTMQEYLDLESLAREDHRSLSSAIRVALIEYLGRLKVKRAG